MAKGTQNGTSGDLNKYTLTLLYFFVGIIDFEAGESYMTVINHIITVLYF